MEKHTSFWPEAVPSTLIYQYGERPLHEYLSIQAERKPNEIAIHYYGYQLTWEKWNQHSNQLANYLERIGVKQGDHIALFMQNCPQYLISHYAIQKLGAVVVPLNPMYKASELSYLIKEADIKGIICGLELLPMLEAIEDALSFIVTVTYQSLLLPEQIESAPSEIKCPVKPSRFTTLESLFDTEENSFQSARVQLNDVCLMVFTSGTTGRPKAAMLTYENALFKTASTMTCNQIKQDDKLLAIAPLCHIAGMVMGVNLPVYSGNETVLLSRFDAETVVSAIEDHRISMWYSIAPMNGAILQMPDLNERDLTSLRLNLATSFGVQVTRNLADQWKKATNGCLLYEASYGLSETHTCDTFMPTENVKFGSCGIPIHKTNLKIVNTNSEEVGPLKEGEIVIKSPGVFKGYYNRPDETAASLKNGWVYTGDIGYIDEEGYLYFRGRLKEMIKSSGYSVFPEDVEALMNEHPAIKQTAVIGIPDQQKGEIIKAVVVLHPNHFNASIEELTEWAKNHMAAYKAPKIIEIRESLPATSSGKVLRRLLKK
ncbi:class I adenylate-forming enzyme family protein [Bacillus sp. N1-1]|uniref:class I adenylate-forming enzyme family protein n=1 Tax=Bacillus sp. N1-1 TaxID=2682541 RepID=UPI001318E630|nr:class I adenylate-forming enzyme family protein [Bacillus sp. N1-1]QHA92175.1 AMP-binding protein [Bacillus sp. N1-1]